MRPAFRAIKPTMLIATRGGRAPGDTLTLPHLSRYSAFALLGSCAYLAGSALPLPWHFRGIGLVLIGALAVISGLRHRAPVWSPLTVAVLVFLTSVGVSTILSENVGRSIRLSTPFLPGTLLFFVVVDYFEGLREVHLLYLTLSAVALGLAVVVLLAAWQGHGGTNVRTLVSSLGIPIVFVPNDLTWLAVVAPLSLVLLYSEPRGGIGLVAATSIFLSLCAICITRSRTAALTMGVGLICVAVIVQPRQLLIRSLAGMLALLGTALLVNVLLFPESQLVAKFTSKWTLSGRTTLWSTAWAMFREAPLVGKGPHTFGLFHNIPWPHNLYLEVLAEQGIIGLLALGYLALRGLSAACKVQRTATMEGKLFGAGALAGLISFWCAGGVELTLLREWVVTTLFMLLGIIGHLLASRPEKAVTAAEPSAVESFARGRLTIAGKSPDDYAPRRPAALIPLSNEGNEACRMHDRPTSPDLAECWTAAPKPSGAWAGS